MIRACRAQNTTFVDFHLSVHDDPQVAKTIKIRTRISQFLFEIFFSHFFIELSPRISHQQPRSRQWQLKRARCSSFCFSWDVLHLFSRLEYHLYEPGSCNLPKAMRQNRRHCHNRKHLQRQSATGWKCFKRRTLKAQRPCSKGPSA